MEGIPTGPSPEEQKRLEEQEEAERLAYFLQTHPEPGKALEKRECGPEIKEFESKIKLFESEYSLEELTAIVTPEDLERDERTNALRYYAKKALGPIVFQLNALEKETDISQEKLQELKVKYKRLSQAVGIINNNKVDHTR